jgi:hypothetical protein
LDLKFTWQYHSPLFKTLSSLSDLRTCRVTFCTTNLWKASLRYAELREETCHFSPPAGSKAAWVNLQNKQVSIMHHTWLPYLSPWEHNPAQPLDKWNPYPQQNWKAQTVNCILIPTAEMEVEHLTCPQRMGMGQGAELSVPNSQWTNVGKATKAESRRGTTSQPPKAGQVVDPRAVSWHGGQYSKLNCSTLLGEELTRVVAIGQYSCHLVKTTTALTILHELAVSYLSSQLQLALWTEGTKKYSQVSHLVRPH